MATRSELQVRIKIYRQQRGWSQDELAQRVGISRAAVSAIENKRIVPSVAAALAMASAFSCRVEELFASISGEAEETTWAWPAPQEPCRFWHARVASRVVFYPVEATVAGVIPHDGVFRRGSFELNNVVSPENTLVMASCDPAAGLLANEMASTSDFRLLALHRSSRQALDLLGRGLADVAGIHLAKANHEKDNALAVRSILGSGYSLLKTAIWQEGLALGAGVSTSSVQALLRGRVRWVGREPGSGARQCQDELLQDRPQPRRLAKDHRGVAEAIRCGWADAGVCIRLTSEEAGLRFIKVRDEAYDLCFRTSMESDPRLRALLQVVRSMNFRKWLCELPGYDARGAGEIVRVE